MFFVLVLQLLVSELFFATGVHFVSLDLNYLNLISFLEPQKIVVQGISKKVSIKTLILTFMITLIHSFVISFDPLDL